MFLLTRLFMAPIETTTTSSHSCDGKQEESYCSSTSGPERYEPVKLSHRWFTLAEALFEDINELSLPSTMKIHFPDVDDLLNFTLTIEPDEGESVIFFATPSIHPVDGKSLIINCLFPGMYKTGSFNFTFAINQNFPHEPPKVKCTQKIYHPNIDVDGNVCLNILREDWKPVLNLNAVMVGLQVCFA